MTNVSLEDFADRVLTKNRIGKYDVQILQRDILKDGVTSRDEADRLIALDRQVASVHFSWSAFFIAALSEFAVWRSGRAGYIDQDKSEWLLAALAGDGATDRARRTLVRIAQEAECFDEAFFAPAPRRASGGRPPVRGVSEYGLAA